MIHEAVVTTLDGGRVHITPLGYRRAGDGVLLAPFVPSRTLDNLRIHGEAVLNFVDDVRLFAGPLTGRSEWPTAAAERVSVPRIRDALAHWELRVTDIKEHPERPEFCCRIVQRGQHGAFTGFNRAQAAVIELAILVSRLPWLPQEKVRREMEYLQIAVDKTAGPRELEAWQWLAAAVAAHPNADVVRESRV